MTTSAIYFRNINHNLYQFLENNSNAEASQLINNNFPILLKGYNGTKETKGFISLVLKFYISSNDSINLDNIYISYKNTLMKRDILNYSYYYYKSDYKKALDSFNYLMENYYIDSSNLDFIISNNMDRFIILLDGSYIKTTNSTNSVYLDNYDILRKYPFNQRIINDTISKIKDQLNEEKILKFNRIMEPYKTNKKIIIDAGNILFAVNGNITLNSYIHLIKFIKYFKNNNITPIIVIHTRHLKKTFKGNQKDKKIINAIDIIYSLSDNLILETPYNQNDDFYIIYLGLFYQSKILTNDNYKDHIFNFRTNKLESDENMVENYIDDLVSKYNILGDSIVIDHISSLNISKCIQIKNNIVYIPTTNNKFIRYI
jgi:hypothetical protein